MATRRTTKTGLVVAAENSPHRRTTKTGLVIDAENNAPRRVTKLGLIVATEPEVGTSGGIWPRFFSLILTFFLGG